MEFTRADVANTTRAVRQVLGELGLDAYRFTVDPNGKERQVRVEYAATDGWRSTTLRVDGATLIESLDDARARGNISRQWRDRLANARRRLDPDEDLRVQAVALGRAWAEARAQALREHTPGAQWPDFWSDEACGDLPDHLEASQRREMAALASRAARDHWHELVSEERAIESPDLDPEGREVLPSPENAARLVDGWPEGRHI